MKTNARYIVGIDPDLTKSGFAVYDRVEKRLVECTTVSFTGVQWLIEKKYPGCFVRLEAGWLIAKSNWHLSRALGAKYSPITAQRIAERQAKNVGENHAVGKLLNEWLTEKKIPFELVKPFGATTFFKDRKVFKATTGWEARTHNDGRTAAAICWGV